MYLPGQAGCPGGLAVRPRRGRRPAGLFSPVERTPRRSGPHGPATRCRLPWWEAAGGPADGAAGSTRTRRMHWQGAQIARPMCGSHRRSSDRLCGKVPTHRSSFTRPACLMRGARCGGRKSLADRHRHGQFGSTGAPATGREPERLQHPLDERRTDAGSWSHGRPPEGRSRGRRAQGTTDVRFQEGEAQESHEPLSSARTRRGHGHFHGAKP